MGANREVGAQATKVGVALDGYGQHGCDEVVVLGGAEAAAEAAAETAVETAGAKAEATAKAVAEVEAAKVGAVIGGGKTGSKIADEIKVFGPGGATM